MLQRFYNILPLFEIFLIALIPIVLCIYVIFLYPLNEGIVPSEIFGCGQIVERSENYYILVNQAGMRVATVGNYDAKIGEFWSIKSDQGRYFLNFKCD